jgi:PleD family two-component response regulator
LLLRVTAGQVDRGPLSGVKSAGGAGSATELLLRAINMTPRMGPAEQVHVPHEREARPQVKGTPSASVAQKLIYIIENDRDLATELATQLRCFDYLVSIVTTPDELAETADHSSLAAILMDAHPKDIARAQSSIEWMTRIRARVPAILISARGDLSVRLAAARAGFSACVVKPVDIRALVSTLDRLIPTQRPEPERVLIVDSSRQLADHYACALSAAGMLTEAITNPHHILNALAAFQPDLVLMDMLLPGCTGPELASVIRQIETFVLVPIVFLSSEREANRQLAVTRLGGADFLMKPIGDDTLVSAVSSRLHRYRLLRSYVMRDSLTGVLNHAATMERLELEISRAVREQRALCFAMLDMDHFKAIGRLGGDEFGVILPHVSIAAATRLMDELREAFSGVTQHAETYDFTATFSCGLVEFDTGETPDAVVARADRFLYRAKKAGRNHVAR